MIKVMIVDDESIMRVTLHSLINWESYGYTIVSDCTSGAQALDYLKNNNVDLIITDMKMPKMTGLELIKKLLDMSNVPVSVILSGYNEFELVREAFKLGAYDYLLKADLNEISLARLLTKLSNTIFTDKAFLKDGKKANQIKDDFKLDSGEYAVAVFNIDDFVHEAARFGNDLKEKLEMPMLELVRQIPRLSGRIQIRAVVPSQYELCYFVRDKAQLQSSFMSVVRQIQSVWRDYMNISVSVGLSKAVLPNELEEALSVCTVLAKLGALQGHGGVCPEWRYADLAKAYMNHYSNCDLLIEAVCSGESAKAEREKESFFAFAEGFKSEERSQLFLVFIARLCEKLSVYGQDTGDATAADFNYENALKPLKTAKEQELWVRNYLRRVQEYFAQSHRRQQPDAIKKARFFMEDNYTNAELTLKTVADYVGFNEKYFSTRFTKECGCTFISYLNELRLERAKELLQQSGMKMYEISDYVGYNNVEHFNHTFKKKFGISPSDYRNNT